jgi:hypothetical protein
MHNASARLAARSRAWFGRAPAVSSTVVDSGRRSLCPGEASAWTAQLTRSRLVRRRSGTEGGSAACSRADARVRLTRLRPGDRHTSRNQAYGTPLIRVAPKSLLKAMGVPVGVRDSGRPPSENRQSEGSLGSTRMTRRVLRPLPSAATRSMAAWRSSTSNATSRIPSSVDIAFGRSGLVRRRPVAAAWRSRCGSWGCRVGSLPA